MLIQGGDHYIQTQTAAFFPEILVISQLFFSEKQIALQLWMWKLLEITTLDVTKKGMLDGSKFITNQTQT